MKIYLKALFITGLLFIGVSAHAAIDVNKSFAPAVRYPSQISTITVNLQNSSLNPALGAAFTDIFPDDIFVAGTPNITNTCGGTVSSTNNATRGEFSLSGGTIPAGDGTNPGTCSATVDVYSSAKGTFVNQIGIGDVTATVNGSATSNTGATQATLAVILSDFDVAIDYSIGSGSYGYLQGGETMTQTITLTNPNPIALTGIDFTNSLYDTTYNLKALDGTQATTCGGTVTITDRPARISTTGPTSDIDITSATVPANGSCTITFDVNISRDPTATSVAHNLIASIASSTISTNEGATNTVTPTKRAYTRSGLYIRKTFDGAASKEISLLSTSTATLRITFSNYNVTPINGINITDVMPAPGPGAMTVQSIGTNTCGGTLSNTATSLLLNGGSLAAATSGVSGHQTTTCYIEATVSVDQDGTYVNSVPADTTGGHDYTATSATLTASSDALTITKEFKNNFYFQQGDEKNLVYTFTNNTDSATGIDVTNLDLSDVLESSIAGECNDEANKCFRVSSSFAPIVTCQGAVVTAAADGTNIAIDDVTILKGSSCTVTIPIVTRADLYPLGNHYDAIPVGDITFQINGAGASQNYPEIVQSRAYVNNALRGNKSFTPNVVGPLGVSRLKLTLTHYSRSATGYGSYGIDNLKVTDVLPTGHLVAPTPNLVNECGGTVTANAGSNTVSLVNGILPQTNSYATSCDIYVDVQAPALSGGNTTETSTNSVAGDTHGSGSLNLSALKIGENAPYNQLENYYAFSASLTRKATDVTLNKEFLTTTINGGAASRVRITFTNIEPSAINLTGLGITDAFTGTDMLLYTNVNPTFTDNAGGTSGCRIGAGSFIGNPGDTSITLSGVEMDAGAICRFEFNVTAVKGGNHINTIEVGDLITREGVTNSSAASATLTVARQVNIGKTFNPSYIAAGETSELLIEIFNTQTTNETGANPAFIDEMPAGVDIQSIVSNNCGGTLTIGTQNGNDTLELNGGNFTAESVCQIRANVTASATGEYLNTIEIGDLVTVLNATNPDQATAKLFIVAQPTITKSFSPTSIALNGRSRVRLLISNPNNATLLPGGFTEVSLTDNLTNMEIASPPSVSGTCTNLEYVAIPGSNTFQVTNATIQPSGSCYIYFYVTSSTAGQHDNTSSGISTNQTTTDSNVSNTAILTVLEPLTFIKSFVQNSIDISQISKLIFTITNPNPIAVSLTSLAMTDAFPVAPGIMKIASPLNIVKTGCSPQTRNVANTANSVAGDTGILLRYGNIQANSTCTVSVDIDVNAEGTYTNTTSSLLSNAGTTAAASANLEVTNIPTANLVTTKIVDDSTPKQGENIEYTITVTNNGWDDATNVTLTDQLPTGVSYVSDDSGGDYNSTTGIWTIGSIANGSSKVIKITATVTASAGTNVTNTITSTASTVDQFDSTTTDDDLVEQIGVDSFESNLVTTKTVDNSSPKEGDTIEYIITVLNNGPDDTTNVTLTDQLPTGVSYVSDDSGGDYNSTTGIWTIGSIANGSSKVIKITATIDSLTSGMTITNTITSTASTVDSIDSTTVGDDLIEGIVVVLTPPVIGSNGGGDSVSLGIQENEIRVTIVSADDIQDDAGNINLIYSISGGLDAVLFVIDQITGELTFLVAPDFENPLDDGADNIYDIQVTVTDSDMMTDVQDIAITVEDTNESSSHSGGTVRYSCNDEDAINYSQFGRHKQSLCEYENEEVSEPEFIEDDSEEPLCREEIQRQCPVFTQHMKLGDKDGFVGGNKQELGVSSVISEIKLLQTHLKKQGFNPGPIDGIYDQRTYNAVSAWQMKYFDSVLKPWGFTGPTGNFYQSSERNMNIILGCNDTVTLDTGIILSEDFSLKIVDYAQSSCEEAFFEETKQCPIFTQYMRNGDRDGFIGKDKQGIGVPQILKEVKLLQKHLNLQGINVGQLDGIFGIKTENAVSAWQMKYFDSVLKPWNLKKPTGRFYQSSERYMNVLLDCEDTVTLDTGIYLSS